MERLNTFYEIYLPEQTQNIN